MLSRLAGVSEAGARWRNPERLSRGNCNSRESFVHCAGLLRRAGSADVGHDHRPEVSGGDAGDLGAVRGEVGVAAQGRAARGQGCGVGFGLELKADR
jgi:hypothetical protein